MGTENTINELPLIQGKQTDQLQVGGYESMSYPVTDVAGRPDLPANTTAVLVQYPSDTVLSDNVFMGGTNVSVVLGHANRGAMLVKGASLDLDACQLPYFISPAGKTTIITIFYGK